MRIEKKTQLYFYDDDKFQFRKLPLQYGCLLDKNQQKIIKAWRHSYAGQYQFHGYKGISADAVTLGFGRDIFLDPHSKIPLTDDISGKPKNIKKWIGQIAENQRHTYRAKAQGHTMNDWINYCLIGVVAIMSLAWLIRFATER